MGARYDLAQCAHASSRKPGRLFTFAKVEDDIREVECNRWTTRVSSLGQPGTQEMVISD